MKKVISVLLTVSIVFATLCIVPFAASAAFPDLAADHWAYAQVERLVADGTINGMPDGSFNPTGVVTRAEFVKMLGKSDVRFDKDFNDVLPSHWAYDYIMYSQLSGDANGNFGPANIITRGEVANLLYKRYANGAKEIAPYYITSQGTDVNAVAWVYNTGLMVGGDMLNLRLDDTLTRAEAAVLIVRAKDLDPSAKKNFIDNFPAETYKNVYEGSNLFDSEYTETGSITYEELAAAAMRFEYKYRNPAIRYVYEAKYEGDYAEYWDIACRYALDDKGYDSGKESASQYVSVEDAIAMLTLAAQNNLYVESNIEKVRNNETYAGVSFKNNESKFAERMRYAYNFGISLYANANINPKRIVTKKELACIVMQYSLTFGSQVGYHCGLEPEYLPEFVRVSPSSYPAARLFYSQIAESIPNYVYEKPFVNYETIKIAPNDFAKTTAMIAYSYAKSFMYICEEAYEKGSIIYIDFYPTLSLRYDDLTEAFRVKLTVDSAFEGMKLSDVLPLKEGVADRVLSAGDSLWCDINTNSSTIGKLYIDYTIMTIDQIVER